MYDDDDEDEDLKDAANLLRAKLAELSCGLKNSDLPPGTAIDLTGIVLKFKRTPEVWIIDELRASGAVVLLGSTK